MYFESQCKCTRHKAQKLVRSSRYSNSQKQCQICETFIEWDVTFCSCYGQKLRTREYKTILISSEKTNLTSNSLAKLLDHTSRISKGLMYRRRMNNKVIAGIENITRCLTCNVYFCRLCGKRVNHAQIHTDRLACEKRRANQRTRESY